MHASGQVIHLQFDFGANTPEIRVMVLPVCYPVNVVVKFGQRHDMRQERGKRHRHGLQLTLLPYRQHWVR
jgi:hypothetical protein